MAVSVEIDVSHELVDAEPALPATLRRFKERLNALPPTELESVLETVTGALSRAETPVRKSAAVDRLTSGGQANLEQQLSAEIDILMCSFARRRELLAGALTASQVAKLLKSTRQTPHDRRKSGTLLAVLDRGAWRFPTWQFDPEGEQGVVSGLPAVIRALEVSPIAKLSWLTRPNPFLDNLTPLTCLNAGETDRVVALARAVGAD